MLDTRRFRGFFSGSTLAEIPAGGRLPVFAPVGAEAFGPLPAVEQFLNGRVCWGLIESGAGGIVPRDDGATMAGMTSREIQPEQARKLLATVGRQLRFLNRLCGRMQMLRFGTDDPLWRAAIEARNAMQDLHVAAHYAGCRSGVGK